MIVTDKNVSDALAYLAIDPHPIALARKDVTDAENARKECYAKAFLAADGNIEERRCAAEIDAEHKAAKATESGDIMELERHRARARAADMLIECWRTEQSNIRAAEKVR